MRKYVLIIGILLTGRVSVFAQPYEQPSIPKQFVEDLRIALYQGIAYYTSPFHMDADDAWNLAKFGAGTVAALALDKEAANNARKLAHSSGMNAVMDIGYGYGAVQYALILPSGLYLGGLFAKNNDIRTTGRQIFQALLYSTVVTQSLKWMIGRARPDVLNDPFTAKPFNFTDPSDAYFSMPSGHATVAFAVSSVLADRIDNVYASIGLYALATTTAISRMYHDRHWLSDVFVGATIGTATGLFVTRQDRQKDEDISHPLEIEVSPMRLQLQYKF